MHDVKHNLINRLDQARELVQNSEPSLCVGTSQQKAIEALDHLRSQVVAEQTVDFLKARQLFAPTGLLHEISFDNDWGHQFIRLARDVEHLLARLKEQA